MSLPLIHLSILHPAGHLASLALVDAARYLRYQFRRLGAQVEIGRNRVNPAAVNLVLGGHHGVPTDWLRRATCVLLNLEQLAPATASVSADYLRLLAHSAVIDYDPQNVATYTAEPQNVPLLSFGYAPYLDIEPPLPTEARPIDLLFFGTLNAQREQRIAQIEAHGVQVSVFDQPVYGPERDHYIQQSKAVLNLSPDPKAHFAQVRAFHCLSLGTPVISDRVTQGEIPRAFHDAVFWIPEAGQERFFREAFHAPAFPEEARRRIERFRCTDGLEECAELLAFLSGYGQAAQTLRSALPWHPTRLEIRPTEVDLLDWTAEEPEPTQAVEPHIALAEVLARLGVPAAACSDTPALAPASLSSIHLEASPGAFLGIEAALDTLSTLLRPGGIVWLDFPALMMPGLETVTGTPTPSDSAALRSWTDRHLRGGHPDHRFEWQALEWRDASDQHCAPKEAAVLRLILVKVPTTLRERMQARALRADFGGIAEDLLPGGELPATAPPLILEQMSAASESVAPPTASTVGDDAFSIPRRAGLKTDRAVTAKPEAPRLPSYLQRLAQPH